MTRLHAMPLVPPAPVSVRLVELAVAAGVAGHSITLCFQDYPAPILSEVWKIIVNQLGAERVFQVTSQADIRKLAEAVAYHRLVLVHNPRLVTATGWAIQMANATSCPAVFCRSAPSDLDNAPGATLSVWASAREVNMIQQSFMIRDHALANIGDMARPEEISVAPELVALVTGTQPAGDHGLQCFRDRQVLHSLLTGACLLRAVQQGNPAGGPLTINMQDYAMVRAVLQSPVIAAADEAFDPIAATMVRRANVYLSVMLAANSDAQNFVGVDGADAHSGRPPRELITRREVADLGNVHSRVVRRLITCLQRQPDGYEQFGRLGLVRRPPARDRWTSEPLESLVSCLRGWSVKQVRSHFDQLHRAGLISAERRQANGPWLYRLPEELTNRSMPFRALPTAEEFGVAGPGQ